MKSRLKSVENGFSLTPAAEAFLFHTFTQKCFVCIFCVFGSWEVLKSQLAYDMCSLQPAHRRRTSQLHELVGTLASFCTESKRLKNPGHRHKGGKFYRWMDGFYFWRSATRSVQAAAGQRCSVSVQMLKTRRFLPPVNIVVLTHFQVFIRQKYSVQLYIWGYFLISSPDHKLYSDTHVLK